MSRIENRVAAEILGRAAKGKAKYGVTMDRQDLSPLEWLQHAKEEAMDLAVYLEKLIQEYNYMPPCSGHNQASEEEECDGVLGSHPLCCTDYCPCKEAEIEKRMNIIGQNGNDGLHYGSEEDGTGYVNYPSDELDYLASKTNWANKKEVQKKQQISDYPEGNITTTLYPGDIIVTYDEIQTEKGKENS